MTSRFASPAPELPRDRWGRPLITPPSGGEPEAYTRVTTFVKAIDDTYHLNLWMQRMVVLGMARRRDLVIAASAITDPKDRSQKKTLDSLAKAAKDAADGSFRASLGTALHSFSERVDRGESLAGAPEDFLPDLAAYAEAREPFEVLAIEQFVVNDELKVGGTLDRLVRVPAGYLSDDDPGGALIADLKTGDNVEFGIGTIAAQLAVYAHGEVYDHVDGSRVAHPSDLRTDVGIVFHVPAGQGVARVLLVDLELAWIVASEVIPRVTSWRKEKGLFRVLAEHRATPAAAPTVVELIAEAASYDELAAIYRANEHRWTPGLTTAAAARRDELATA